MHSVLTATHGLIACDQTRGFLLCFGKWVWRQKASRDKAGLGAYTGQAPRPAARSPEQDTVLRSREAVKAPTDIRYVWVDEFWRICHIVLPRIVASTRTFAPIAERLETVPANLMVSQLLVFPLL